MAIKSESKQQYNPHKILVKQSLSNLSEQISHESLNSLHIYLLLRTFTKRLAITRYQIQQTITSEHPTYQHCTITRN